MVLVVMMEKAVQTEQEDGREEKDRHTEVCAGNV